MYAPVTTNSHLHNAGYSTTRLHCYAGPTIESDDVEPPEPEKVIISVTKATEIALYLDGHNTGTNQGEAVGVGAVVYSYQYAALCRNGDVNPTFTAV